MGLLKSVIRSDKVQKSFCWIGVQYIRFVHLTGRWRVINGEVPRAFWRENKPMIMAFWHGRMLLMSYAWNDKKWNHDHDMHMLISPHRDGQLIANIVEKLSIKTIKGSSFQGGTGALRSMLKYLKNGKSVGITPDGPRGPCMQLTPGIVSLAKMSGIPVVPASFSTTRQKRLRSWDQFVLAFPFSRGVFVWGDPIVVPKYATNDDLERFRVKIENALNRVTSESDRLCGKSTDYFQ